MTWLLRLPHPVPPSAFSKLDRRHTGRLWQRDNLLTGIGKVVGEEPNHTIGRKPDINLLILSVSNISVKKTQVIQQ
jgi:hypothetical protein